MTINYFWQLDRHPVGHAFVDALSLRTETLAPLRPGEVRIRADWLSMDSGTRMWMSPRTDGYQPPLPLGSKMVGLALGRVVVINAHRFFEPERLHQFACHARIFTHDQIDG